MLKRAVEDIIGPLSDVAQKNAPGVLYLEGDEALLHAGVRVCIIGTRKPSELGRSYARLLAEFLVENRVTVVSGLAMGIDTEAHVAAIDRGGRTIAVLGTPLDRVNPPSNADLQREIGAHHLLVTQFAPNSQVRPSNFPQRNRTMALLSDATIIVEARSETSGTLHQGWEALRLGRPLFIMQALVNSGLKWPKRMLDYGAVPITLPSENDSALYEMLPLNLGPSEQPAL